MFAAAILNAFSSQNEDVKTGASYALGGVAVGNLGKYLPFVLKEIDSQPKRQYLLLHSLKVTLKPCIHSKLRQKYCIHAR